MLQSNRIRLIDGLAVFALAGWVLFFYFPATLGQAMFYIGDIPTHSFPIRVELSRRLAEGALPLWTTGMQAGFPLLAEGQVAALYPLNLLLYRILPMPLAFSYSILLHYIWALLGMYALARVARFSAPASLLAALVFGLNGFFITRSQHVPHVAVGSWLPWMLLFYLKYERARTGGRNSILWFCLTVFSIAVQLLGGFPQVALMNLAAFAVFGILGFRLWGDSERKDPFPQILRQLAHNATVLFAALVLGAGLAAIQWLPSAELLGFSVRGSDVGTEFFTSFSLEVEALSQFIAPFAWLGTPHVHNIEFWGYIGVLPLMLAVLAPFLKRDWRTISISAFSLLALSLALGAANPLYSLLYYVPVFNRFRVPARFLELFCFGAAILAAIGFDELRKRLPDFPVTRLRVQSFWFGIVVAIIAIILVGHSQPLDSWLEFWRLFPWILILGSVALLWAIWSKFTTRNSLEVMTVGLVMLDLTLYAIPFLHTLNQMVPLAETTTVPRSVRAMDNRESVYRVYSGRAYPATHTASRVALYPNYPMIFGKQGFDIYMALPFRTHDDYLRRMTPALLNLANIRYYLTPLEPPLFFGTMELETFRSQLAREPRYGLTMSKLKDQNEFPPIRVAQVEIVSYTDRTQALPDEFVAGEIMLGHADGRRLNLPIRLGIDTGDWAYEGLAAIGEVKHAQPIHSRSFPAYLSSVGKEFSGRKYVARYDVAEDTLPIRIAQIRVESNLPDAGLNIESITFRDGEGQAVSLASLLQQSEMELVFRSHTAAMWENHDALPRALVVHAAETMRDSAILERMQRADFEPHRVVLLSDGEPLKSISESRDEVRIIAYESEYIELQVKTEAKGYLVLADTWYPGWVAEVDGQATPIHRGDYIFRAVPLAAGDHRVIFKYQPTSFYGGAAISLISAFVLCGITFWKGLRVRRRHGIVGKNRY